MDSLKGVLGHVVSCQHFLRSDVKDSINPKKTLKKRRVTIPLPRDRDQ